MYKKLYEIHSESLSLDPSIHWHTWLVHITYTINMAYFKGLFDLFICFCVSKFRLHCSEMDDLAIHHTYCMHNVSHCLPVSFCNFWMLFAFQQKAWMSKSIVYWCMTMYSVVIDSENATGSSQYWTGMMKVNTQQSLKTVTVRLCWKKNMHVHVQVQWNLSIKDVQIKDTSLIRHIEMCVVYWARA